MHKEEQFLQFNLFGNKSMLNIAWIMVTILFPLVSLIGAFVGLISKRIGSKGLMVTTIIWIVAIIIFPSLRMPWYAENFGFTKKSTPENTVTKEENKTTSETFKMEDFILQVGSKDITVNHEALTLNAPFVEIDGHSYIPLRFFLDWFSAGNITYDEKTEKVSFSMKRYGLLDADIKNKYRRKEPYEVIKIAPVKEIKYKIEVRDVSWAGAKRMSYSVLFEDDEVTIKEVEKILRKVADEKIKTDNPDALVVHAKLESQAIKGNTVYWASLIWAPGGKWENANKNTPKNQNSFTFEDRTEFYEQIKKLYK